MRALESILRSKGNLQESVLSFNLWVPGIKLRLSQGPAPHGFLQQIQVAVLPASFLSLYGFPSIAVLIFLTLMALTLGKSV